MGGGLAKYAPDALLSKEEARSALGDDFDDLRWEELAREQSEGGRIRAEALVEEVEYEAQKEPEGPDGDEDLWADRDLPAALAGVRDHMNGGGGGGGADYYFDRDEFARELEAIDGAFSDEEDESDDGLPHKASVVGAGAAFGEQAAMYDPDYEPEAAAELTPEETHELKMKEIAAEGAKL